MCLGSVAYIYPASLAFGVQEVDGTPTLVLGETQQLLYKRTLWSLWEPVCPRGRGHPEQRTYIHECCTSWAECSASPQSQATRNGERATVSCGVLVWNPKSYLISEIRKPVEPGNTNVDGQCSVVEREVALESVLVWVSALPWLATWLGAGVLNLLTVVFLVCPMRRTGSSLIISRTGLGWLLFLHTVYIPSPQ